MTSPTSSVNVTVATKNHGGILDNPFEFRREGDKKANEILKLICPNFVLNKLKIDKHQIPGMKPAEVLKENDDKKVRDQDKEYGPKLGEIITESRLKKLSKRQREFIEKHRHQKLFHILHNNSSMLLGIDKNIRDDVGAGKIKPLRILSNCTPINTNENQAIEDVFDDVFKYGKKRSNEVLWDKAAGKEKNTLSEEDKKALIDAFGEEDAKWLCSEEGQILFFALREAMHVRLCQGQLQTVNDVKAEFGKTIGNAQKKVDNTLSSVQNHSVAMLQECDKALIAKVNAKSSFWKKIRHKIEPHAFWSLAGQKSKGGSAHVLLKRANWAPPTSKDKKPRVIDFKDSYGKIEKGRYQEGKVNGVLARNQATGKLVFAVSCHARENKYSTDKPPKLIGLNDAINQLTAIRTEWEKLKDEFPGEEIELMIGGDFNTKKQEATHELQMFCMDKGLKITDTSATSVKQRADTTQQPKAGDMVKATEDFLISNKPFVEGATTPEKSTTAPTLPNTENYSDHFVVASQVAFKVSEPTEKEEAVKAADTKTRFTVRGLFSKKPKYEEH